MREDLDQGNSGGSPSPSSHPGNPDDLWIEACTINGMERQFCSVYTISYPYGLHGPAEARIRFNLSAYVRHEIARALHGTR